MMRARDCLGLALATAVLGCASGAQSRSAPAPLPFSVRVEIVELPAAPGETGERSPAVPVRFGEDRGALEARLARSLEEVGLFSRVFAGAAADGEEPADEDLLLEVAIQGRDFGAGRVKVASAIFSTLAWICAGHLSWLIEDRYYPDSDVSMTVSIHRRQRAARSAAAEGQPIYVDPLPIQDLEVAFIDRVDAGRGFLNIVVPPCYGDGSPAVTGASLAERSFGFFARQEPAQIQGRLPALYFEDAGAYLVFDASSRRAAIVSRRDLRSITIRGNGPPRELTGKLLDSPAHLVTRERPAELEELERQVSERARGIGRKSHYYQVPLADDEHGLVRIEAELGDGASAGRWTIDAAPPGAQTRIVTRGSSVATR